MTVTELIKELKQYPKDALVYKVQNWETVDEEGHLTDLEEVTDVNHQVYFIDEGMDWTEVTEVLL